ncbi:Icc protein/phosphoribosylglycinamide formyltransferase-1 [Mucilaginibacter lappiensis]|uniref:Icc-related predicted phosphoesterase n=1 Tax=Mucilaginibacter lappiensis TaxID=354630 RepID=A0ABR6PR35_9SPHI|nr:metallophosphoesterase [Mucilaginibacter lappiensis]MBB6112195.1 Icc-related predicted phosphoesterase [Mucilaginibacter lappiensis]SIR98996.1 Icc protein/phosphoribosylglycinamide formyltransferase-1 [Mucilaginibacter lappiensis]
MTSTKTIAYVTDIHLGQQLQIEDGIGNGKMGYLSNPDEHKENFIVILNDMQKRGVQEFVFGGDIGAKDANWWFFDAIKKYQLKLLMVLGNHDTFAEVGKHYNNSLIDGKDEMNYSYEDNQRKYIILDSSSNSVSNGQLDWLGRQVNTSKKILLFIHHPVLKINTLIDEIGAVLNGREELKKILIDSAKDITIICGHYHMTDEAIEKNIRQISTVAGSYQILKESSKVTTDQNSFGYLLIQMVGDSIKPETVLFKQA